MKTARIIALAAIATTAFAVQAESKPARPAKSAAVTAPSAESIVAARQSAMVMSVGATSALRSAAANGTPVKNLAFVAQGLAQWGTALPAMFAPSTANVPSRAKAEVWTDQAEFAAKAKAFADATAALAAAAKADDKDAFTAALASTGAACKGCHESFQMAPPAAKAG